MFRPRYAVVTVPVNPPEKPLAICGLVLAAGAGSRFGGPKALAVDAEGTPWVQRAVGMLRVAGCDPVLVALGAAADAARRLVPPAARVIVVQDWADGLSATLRAGLATATEVVADAVLITPVDTPDAPPDAATRVIASARAAASADRVLARATYGGRPGHPVLIGRSHWRALTEALSGDAGAGAYLSAHAVLDVECSDLWSGRDVDRRVDPQLS